MGLVPKTRYDGVAMIIHWLTAVLMIYMVFFGEDLMKSGEKLAKAGDTAGATAGDTADCSAVDSAGSSPRVPASSAVSCA